MKTKSKTFWFSVVPSIVLSTIMLLFYPFYLNPIFKGQIIRDTQEHSKAISAHFIAQFLPNKFKTLDAELIEKNRESIRQDIDVFGLWKIRFFNSEGVISFSSVESEIGTSHGKQFFFDVVGNGQIISKLEKKGGPTFGEDQTVPYDVVETYVPVMHGKEFKGAVEIYIDVTDQLLSVNQLFRNSYMIICFIIFVLVGFIISFSFKIDKSFNEKEQLIAELKKTLSEVKTLRGFLPICASCKKIRDDKGYWRQIESYITKHTGVDFSHSVCPECNEKLYGDEEWFEKSKKLF